MHVVTYQTATALFPVMSPAHSFINQPEYKV